jgi:hypothetical protein
MLAEPTSAGQLHCIEDFGDMLWHTGWWDGDGPVRERTMADIFVSYASADRDRAKALADALATHGWSVWWDRIIPPGRQFDEVIEEELAAAGCVVVLWSKASVASSWVKTEAAEARDRKILVPVLIEAVKIPLEFRRLQAADLSQWRAGELGPGFDEFSRAIAAQLSRRGQPRTVPTGEPPEPAQVTHAVSRSEPAVGYERPPRPASPARSPAVLAAIGGVAMAAVLAVTYVVYSGTDGRPPSEREARERTPTKAAQAVVPAARPERTEDHRAPSEAAPRPRVAKPAPLDINGVWRDTTWGHMSQIAQDGEAFHFTAWGSACRGNFRSSGTGTVRGTRFESAYRSTMPSEGRCSGTVSADGTQIRSTCVDSVCGSFASSAVRQ